MSKITRPVAAIKSLRFALFKLNQALCGYGIIGGVVYIEPEGSRYADKDSFSVIEEKLLEFGDTPIILLGDFNARTKCLNDFFEYDKYNFDSFNSPGDSEVRLENQELLESLGFSQDKENHNNGYKLVELCENTGILIVNGRVGNDANIGKFTCKNVSVIDYALASHSLFPYICHFDVLPFNDTFSDIHCPFHVKVRRNNSKSIDVGIIIHDNSGNRIKSNWKQEFANVFSSNIDSSKVYELHQLIELLQSTDSVTQENIDFIYGEIKTGLHNSVLLAEHFGLKAIIPNENLENV